MDRASIQAAPLPDHGIGGVDLLGEQIKLLLFRSAERFLLLDAGLVGLSTSSNSPFTSTHQQQISTSDLCFHQIRRATSPPARI
ncbi:unnamed protein product, partial [Musa acuminata subsp. burmannicoides]